MGLNKSQRRALAAEALGDDLGEIDMDAVDQTPAPPTVTLTLEQIQGMISAAVSAAAGQSAVSSDIGTQIAEALRNNRQPIPENTDKDYHGISEYNPEGKAAPRPELPCPYWFAVWDAEEKRAYPVREMEPATLTNDEIRELAQIVPGKYTMKKSDGARVPVNVVDQVDGFGEILRRQIAFPRNQFDKEHRNQLPILLDFHRLMEPVAA